MKYAFTYLGIDLYLSNKDWHGISVLYPNEFWKDIIEYEGRYQISTLGRVKGLDRTYGAISRNGKKFIKSVKGVFRSQHMNISDGYQYVGLTKESKGKTKKVHRMVAEAFLPKIDGKEYIDHICPLKNFNWISNLRWCTFSENIRFACELGIYDKKGVKHHNAKRTEEEIINIKTLAKEGYKDREISEITGFDRRYITNITNGSAWKHIKI